jgi:hypothetical protein
MQLFKPTKMTPAYVWLFGFFFIAALFFAISRPDQMRTIAALLTFGTFLVAFVKLRRGE